MNNSIEVKKGKISELTRRVKVGFVGTCEKYYTDEKKYPMIRTTNLSETGINYDDLKYVTEEFYINNKKSQLHDGDVLIARFGTSGTACVYHGGDAQCLNAIIVEPNCENTIPEYLAIVINSRKVREQVNRRIVGSTQAILNTKVLSDIEIELPDLNEQKRICDILFGIRKVIVQRIDEIGRLDELIKARFVEMFGDGYPEDSLINLCNIIDYRGKTPKKVESGLPFITAKNIKMHHMSMEPREYISKDTYDKVMVRGFPKEGDVVFTTEAPLGNVCRIPHFDTEFYIGQRIVTLQTVKLIPAYLEYAVSTDAFRQKYMEKSSGSTVTGIRVRLLEQLTIPVPPRELQLQFEAFVKQVDKSKSVVQKSLNEAQMLFDSLMQEYFG